MNVRRLREVIVILAVLLLAVIFGMAVQSQESYAAKKIKGTTYEQVMKYKNTAYVIGCSGLYKVKLKNGKAKKITRLVKMTETFGPDSLLYGMRKKGSYIYYVSGTNGTSSRLIRVGIRSHKIKTLAKNTYKYAFKGKKIYYTVEDDISTHNRVMSINGKNKKKTKVKVVRIDKETNAKGYKVINKGKGKYVISYLKTPKGKFRLGKVKNYSW